MLWVSTDIVEISKFKEIFLSNFDKKTVFLDLSKTTSSNLVTESTAIVNHHSNCIVFLGYLEPGWMLDSPSQTLLRKLFRKFPVAFVCNFVESIPFSWKNEIEYLYTPFPVNKNGASCIVNNGSVIQHESQI
jgi:hypothetical protein